MKLRSAISEKHLEVKSLLLSCVLHIRNTSTARPTGKIHGARATKGMLETFPRFDTSAYELIVCKGLVHHKHSVLVEKFSTSPFDAT